jgi:hypothetical protein
MGWETRGGRSYLYQKVRRGGRVVSEYIGTGLLAEFVVSQTVEKRFRRVTESEAEQAQRAALEAVERPLVEWCNQVEVFTRAVLEAANYHRHARGRWRKRRMTASGTPAQSGKERSDPEEERRVLELAAQGDKSCLPQLRALLDAGGDLALEIAGNPDWYATEALVNRCTGENLYLHEAMTRKVTRVRDDLAGPNPSPMERLLAERAALCWLDCSLADLRQARGHASLTRAQSDHLSRYRDRAHRRFLTALKTLATIRTLNLPAVSKSTSARIK